MAFTAIFDKTGHLLKQLDLPEDSTINAGVARADVDFVDPLNPKSTNLAISLGDLILGSNGKAYLMRRLRPGIIYEIDRQGNFRRFEYSPSDASSYPITLQEAGGTLAIVFQNQTTNQLTMTISSLSNSEERREYQLTDTGAGLACLSESRRLTFLTVQGNQPTFRIASIPPQ